MIYVNTKAIGGNIVTETQAIKIDNNSISRVVYEYSDTIVRIAFQYTKNKHDSEDIMQSVFLSLLKVSFFNTEEHLKAWLIRVTINKCKNFLKSVRKRPTVPFDTLENCLTIEETSAIDIFEKIPEKMRDIFYLIYYEGYTAKEAADIIGIKEKALLMRVSRAKKELKELWSDD